MDLFFDSDIVNPLLKTNGRRDRRFNFVAFIVWSALLLGVKGCLKSHLWDYWFCSRMGRRVSLAEEDRLCS